MSYRPLKKDLTDGTQICHFCSRPLPSLKAYILENVITKEQVHSGPKCAQDNIDIEYNLALIPDLTRYTLTNQEKEGSDNIGVNNRKTLRLTDEELSLRKAIEYLELRENKLVEAFNTSFEPLKIYYNNYLINGGLETGEIRHILNIEKKVSETSKLTNLQKCYSYDFWIDVGIRKLGDKADNYLVPIRNCLRKYRKISEKQKNGVNNWLKNLDGIPQLK